MQQLVREVKEAENPLDLLRSFSSNPAAFYSSLKAYTMSHGTREKYSNYYRVDIRLDESLGLFPHAFLTYNVVSNQLDFKFSAPDSDTIGLILHGDGKFEFEVYGERKPSDKYLQSMEKILPPGSGFAEWLRPPDIKKDIESFLPAFYAQAQKIGADLAGLPPLAIEVLEGAEFFSKFGQAANAVYEDGSITVEPTRYGALPADLRRLVKCHELVHYLVGSHGEELGWDRGTMRQEEFDRQVKLVKDSGRLLGKIKMSGADPEAHPVSKIFQDALDEMQKMKFEAKAMPHWLGEGATNLIALDILDGMGTPVVNQAYLPETEVATFLQKTVGKELFYRSYLSGNFDLIANEFCKKMKLEPAEFYSLFGIKEDHLERVGAEDVLAGLKALK